MGRLDERRTLGRRWPTLQSPLAVIMTMAGHCAAPVLVAP